MRVLGGLLVGVAAIVAAFGCTAILGVDGVYTLAPATSTDDGSSGDGDPAGGDALSGDGSQAPEPFTALAAGSAHTCGLTPRGGVQCWGATLSPDGGVPTAAGPYNTHPVEIGGFDATPTALTAGGYHTCALLMGGAVQCWGDNDNGELGNKMQVGRSVPTTVLDLPEPIVSLATGKTHTCAVLQGKNVVCWGSNASSELGDGSTTTRTSPVAVQGLPSGVVKAVAVGDAHSCALLDNGNVWCWGSTSEGQTGNAAPSPSPPVAVNMVVNATAISAGAAHTCVVVSGGAIVCWGRNTSDQCGLAMPSSWTAPALVMLPSVVAADTVSAGGDSSCAVLGASADGQVVCWGANTRGELALGPDGGTTSTPAITTVTGVLAMAQGDTHACAIIGAMRDTFCWGANDLGQLGDRTTTDRNEPTLVKGGP
jgi:alpha-tubulin suppressor-like RCC1 family protein